MRLPLFDKYYYYLKAVQDPDPIIDFVTNTYRDIHGRGSPHTLREDFCGTFALCCAWVRQGPAYSAVGVDKNPEPIAYGTRYFLSELEPHEKNRVKIVKKDVGRPGLPRADIIVALNFSFFVLRTRKELLNYFRNCRKSIARKGLFVLDCFGGPDTMGPVEEHTSFRDFTYYWDQVSYDPITGFARFYIHFKRRGERKRLRLFRYDWRMWSIPELKDLLQEAGFSASHVYWEGTNRGGGGSGVFHKRTHGEICQAYVAYLVAKP